MTRSQWQNAQYTDIQREARVSIASADVLAKMRIGSEERSEAARYLSVAMVRERATRDACARCVRAQVCLLMSLLCSCLTGWPRAVLVRLALIGSRLIPILASLVWAGLW